MDDCRSRRSIVSLGDVGYRDSGEEHHPPDITPVGGVPNLKGKVLVRPIAFRPIPGRPSSSTGPCPSSRPGSSAPSPGPPLSRPPSQGFVPGHPLVKDGPRPFGSSQELSRTQPGLSKFSSLDRRSCRGSLPQGGHPTRTLLSQGLSSSGTHSIPANGLRLSSGGGYDAGSSSSLPPVGLTTPTLTLPSVDLGNRLVKEPERRHSLYDSNSRGQYSGRSSSSQQQQPSTGYHHPDQPGPPAAATTATTSTYYHPAGVTTSPNINVNGLPDPGQLHGSRVSLEPRTRHSGAGTPQFRNLSGVQLPLGRSSRGSLSNLNSQMGGVGFSLQRSVSGNNIHDDQGLLIQQLDSSFTGSTSTIDQEFTSTPSPSDSAVGDLETVVKEKDHEIGYLRETMEQNEQVIFKVYEEKERIWEREIRKIKALYDNRIKSTQQKAAKMEQALMNQTIQVQNEKRRLEQELQEMTEAKEKQLQDTRILEAELTSLRKSLEDFEWTSCEKSGEISFLKSQIQDNQGKEHYKNQEMVDLRVEVREVKRLLEARNKEIYQLKSENKTLHGEVLNLQNLVDLEAEGCTLKEVALQKQVIIDRDQFIEKLETRLGQMETENRGLKSEVEAFKENFEVEKANWLDEKEKVIRYQKQLQLNYVQMYKKNKSLESEVDQLKKSLAESSNKQNSSTRSRLFSKFSKFHETQGCH